LRSFPHGDPADPDTNTQANGTFRDNYFMCNSSRMVRLEPGRTTARDALNSIDGASVKAELFRANGW